MSLDSVKKPTLLLVDDDAIIADSLEYMLKEEYQIERASDRLSSFDVLSKMDDSPALALIDLGLPPDTHKPNEGLAVIRKIAQLHPTTRVLVLSGQDDKTHVFRAREGGAVDFIAKPCDIAEIKARLKKHIKADDSSITDEQDIEGIVGSCAAIELLRMQIQQLADSPYPVLIEGESGSGKEVTARNLHRCSVRHQQAFLCLNCAAFNGELLESQLFGHARGAFTGATEARKGFFEEATGGTLLLDEVADLPLDLQAKLLRVLEDGEYYRLGETRSRYATARVLAATNKDIHAEIGKGLFREDLYHRLSVLTIRVPSLNERGDDKLELLEHFKQQVSAQVVTFRFDNEAIELWRSYGFPGNVRELRNIIIRLSVKYPGQNITPAILQQEMSGLRKPADDNSRIAWLTRAMSDTDFKLDKMLKLVEKEAIDMAMQLSNGNISKVAEMLGVNRTTLYGRIDRNGE
ncbi:MAG: sigma-54-dependent Fis family transcriptional regulator [Gammaproteobacteria bacterium]|nr:sigma-54-dependent Fis family transcriptional regulator [Gammaproteobacteria bacterium]